MMRNLETATNSVLTELKNSDWFCAIEESSDVLLQDGKRNLTFNGQSFLKSTEYQKFLAKQLTEKKAFENFVKRVLFGNRQKEFDSLFPSLSSALNQSVYGVFKTAITANSLATAELIPSVDYTADIRRTKFGVFAVVNIDNIKLRSLDIKNPKQPNQGKVIYDLPGSIVSKFELEDNKFKIIRADFSNPLLEELSLQKDVDCSSETFKNKIQNAKQLEETRDPFVSYLAKERSILISNIKDFKPTATGYNAGVLARIFNDFDAEFVGIQPLTETLEDSLNSGHIAAWTDLSFAITCENLFDKNADNKKEILDTLNSLTTSEHNFSFMNNLDPAKFKSNLFSAFTTEIIGEQVCEKILPSINDKFMAGKDPKTMDYKKSPALIYQREVNPRSAEVNNITPEFIKELDQKLDKALQDKTVPKKLKTAISNFKYNQVRNELVNLIKENKGSDLAAQADNVLAEVDKLKTSGKAPTAELTQTLKTVTAVVKDPLNADLASINKESEKYGKFSWGKLLSGALVAFFGVALIAASTAVLVLTHGGSLPLTLLGLKIGAGKIAAGLATVAGVVGLELSYVGIANFFKGKGVKAGRALDTFYGIAKETKAAEEASSATKTPNNSANTSAVVDSGEKTHTESPTANRRPN